MHRKLSLAAACVCLIFSWSLAYAQNALVVYPNPAEFGIIDLNVVSYPVTFYLTNTTTSSLQITGMTIAGANGADFAFYGANCVGTIASSQTCQMAMTMTPSAIGARNAVLKIAISGVANPISVSLQGTGGNPLPNITSLSPPSAYQGAAATQLTVLGTGFLSSSVAYWNNNSPLPTTYVSSSQLSAQVPATDLATQGSYTVYIANPAPGGGTGQSGTFQVIALDPNLNSVSPLALQSGSAASQISVSGYNFMTGASVLWNGKPIPTTYVNSGQLQAQVSASQLAKAKIVQVSVSNPKPGGVSPFLNFNVTYPAKVTALDLPANDLVWDPFARRIYASLPSSYGANGNSIAVINPFNGAVSAYHFAGSEPSQMALSNDGQYLYVGLNGSGSVQRFILPSFAPDINVSLDTNQQSFTAGSLAVSPTNAHVFGVTLVSGCCNASGPLEFFQDTQLLPDKFNYPAFTNIVFADGTTLYGYENSVLSQVTVSSSGGKLGTQWSGLVLGTNIQYDAGLIYSNGGQAFSPSAGNLVGTYDFATSGCCYSNQVLPDAAINRVLAVGTTPFFTPFGITSYDLSHFTPVAVTNLDQITGNPTTFLRWGGSGLAFVVQPSCCGGSEPQVVLVQSSAMLLTSGGGSNPAPKVTSLAPASATHGSGNLIVKINGTGFVPGSQVTWGGKGLTVEYLSAAQLEVFVPGSDIASAGTASVVVTNPAPTGGISTRTFTIN